MKLDGSDLVFAGYGGDVPVFGWDDCAGIRVKGKTVALFVDDPGFS